MISALQSSPSGADFITSARFSTQREKDSSPCGRLLFVSCRSGVELAHRAVDHYRERMEALGESIHVPHLAGVDFQFSDSETCVRLEEDVSGADAFLFQALYDPTGVRSVDENYMAFLITARALRSWGVNRVTAVLPYLAYARQEKPTRGQREPTTARLMADLAREAGVHRLVTWDPHVAEVQGFYGDLPVVRLDPMEMFVEAFERFRGREDVIAVAPDAGVSKLVTGFGRALDLDCAVASKFRPRPEEAVVSQVMGDFDQKRTAIVLDDMISSGGTMKAVVDKLVGERGIEAVFLGASHNLCRDVARLRLKDMHTAGALQELVVTNSIPQTEALNELPFLAVKDITGVFAWVVNRLHYGRPL